MTDDLSARLIRLPMHYDLGAAELDAVAAAVGEVLGKRVAV